MDTEKLNDVLKHVRWEYLVPLANDDHIKRYGHVGIRVENLRLKLRVLSGPALPAELLVPVLNIALPDFWVEAAETAHQARANPWYVNLYRGMSGCQNHELYSLQNLEFMNQKFAASIHVSMYGKLNCDLDVWLGDLPPLLASLLEEYPPPTEGYELKVYDPELRGEYSEAGKNSGLQETLKNLDAMEVLAK